MNLARIENKLIVASEPVGVAAYDFDFSLHFNCTHPYQFEGDEVCVLRVGAIQDYVAEYESKRDIGLRLINSPEEHLRASELEEWYPLIAEFTPRTRIFEALPAADEIEAEFSWPIFLKGSRQTSKHNPDLSVIRNRTHYVQAAEQYIRDPILHWQKPVVREFVPLQPVAGIVAGKVQPSMEYRSFWWHGTCVGWGRYWYQVPVYECADVEAGLDVASQVAERLQVPFLVIDFAKTADGGWIVIECNDAQESGYTGIQPQELWRRILTSIA